MVNKVKNVTQPEFKKKILIRGLRGIKYKNGVLDTFFKIVHQKFLIFCTMVEGNRAHHLIMVLHLGKNPNPRFIRGLSRDQAIFGGLSIEICQYARFPLDILM